MVPFHVMPCPECSVLTQTVSAVPRSRHVYDAKQQRRLMCDTADMSAESNRRRICCVTRQTCLLCHIADMSAV